MRPGETKSFLVKWEGLPYAEATWEEERDVHDAVGGLTARNAFDQREQRLMEPSKGIEAQRSGLLMKRVAALREQPGFLQGGQLRDYQLEGLNWLTYSWLKVGDCRTINRRTGCGSLLNGLGLWHTRQFYAISFVRGCHWCLARFCMFKQQRMTEQA
jgi:chromodomain-helicase-DNA-binding protein 1